MHDLKDKVILVTGGAMGLGEAIVRAAVEAGGSVAIVDRDTAAAERLAAELPGTRAYHADVSVAEDMLRVCDQVVSDFGRIDGAVNNAGIGGAYAPIADSTPENWNAVIAVSLTGVYYSLRAEIPHILAAGGGAIVNMSSLAGVRANPGVSAYIAAKHGVLGLTKSVALEYGPSGIRCNAICPSFVKTPMTLEAFPDQASWDRVGKLHPIGRTVTPEDVANAAVFFLSFRSAGLTGSAHYLDGGVAATTPFSDLAPE